MMAPLNLGRKGLRPDYVLFIRTCFAMTVVAAKPGYNQIVGNFSPTTSDQLASALHVLGVNFLMGGTNMDESPYQKPAHLIAALAESDDARLRLSLIPLFLQHPEFAAHVRNAAQNLGDTARVTLKCYYSAAVFLQKKHRARFGALIGEKPSLPDYFSRELGLYVTNDPEKNLQLLAQRQEALSGARLNWFGTYQHGELVWIKGLEIQRS